MEDDRWRYVYAFGIGFDVHTNTRAGLNRLPLSFHPLVDNVTSMNRKIERVQFNEATQRVNLQWRDDYSDRVFQNASYDYTVLALPFPIIKRLRLPCKLPTPA